MQPLLKWMTTLVMGVGLAVFAATDALAQDERVKVIEAGEDPQPQTQIDQRIDLEELGVDPTEYDLIKIDVKADRGAFLAVSLENYPAAGPICHWYVLDAMRGPFDWRTIWIDLKRPEELKLPGDRKGMEEADHSLRGLQLRGEVKHTRREGEAPGEQITLGEIRFVKKVVDLDWDQRIAPYEWGTDDDHSTGTAEDDLIFRYPLQVTNVLDEPVTAMLRLEPFEVEHARAELEAETVELAPGETREIEARIILPGSVAASKDPLYAERFQAIASAQGHPDSEVTILRSSDPVHLTVTVPIADSELAFPLLGRRKGLPEGVLNFDMEAAKRAAMAVQPDQLRDVVRRGGFEMAGHWLPPLAWVRAYSGGTPYAERPVNPKNGRLVRNIGGEYLQGVASAAFVYDMTGDEQYLRKAEQLLVAAAELWPEVQAEYDSRDFRLMSEGLFADNTLHLGFKLGGTTRPPYSWGGTKGNAALGSKSGTLNAFDLVAADLDPEVRQKIIDDFILPVGIRTRNQYIGPGNQQVTADYMAMYAGLVARNWPLVSFAYSSEHGLLNNIQWVFDDSGIAVEAVTRNPGYQDYTITPIQWMLELLYHQGINHYDLPAVRAFQEQTGYRDFVNFTKSERYE